MDMEISTQDTETLGSIKIQVCARSPARQCSQAKPNGFPPLGVIPSWGESLTPDKHTVSVGEFFLEYFLVHKKFSEYKTKTEAITKMWPRAWDIAQWLVLTECVLGPGLHPQHHKNEQT